jgi:hypothetical protein
MMHGCKSDRFLRSDSNSEYRRRTSRSYPTSLATQTLPATTAASEPHPSSNRVNNVSSATLVILSSIGNDDQDVLVLE